MADSGGERRISMILRAILTAVALTVAAMSFAPVAAGDKPLMVPSPFPDATGQFCEDFPVLVHATTNQGVTRVFSSGAILFTGSLKVEVTNLDTGKTIALNISGPGKIGAEGSTLVGTGPWLFFGEAGFFGPGSPPELSTNSGRFAIDLADGSFISRLGHSVDLCPLLAAA
jgi:hypothetical protein